MDIGQAIALLRQKKKISQAEFAKQAELTQASLSNIESGKKKPHRSTITRICSVLEIPEEFIFFLTLEESNLPETGRDKFKMVEKQLKELILDAV